MNMYATLQHRKEQRIFYVESAFIQIGIDKCSQNWSVHS